MPDPRQPGSGAFTLAWALALATGVVGIVWQPSATVAMLLDEYRVPWAAHLWSYIILMAGAMALVSRLRRRYQAEVVAALFLAGVFYLWSAILVVATFRFGSTGGVQAAGGFATCASVMVGWATYRGYRLKRSQETAENVRRIVREAVQGEPGRDA